MIAKISRGSRVGDIAAYLHGPGKANEHEWTDSQGLPRQGGVVIASNIGVEGHQGPRQWAADLRLSQQTRPEIRKPIWHCALRNQETDRWLSDADWADIGQQFADQMGYTGQPWVMVRHADDHAHIVMSRVNETGQLWHGRNDYRQAQTVASQLEHDYQLVPAPRRREHDRTPVAAIRTQHQQQTADLAAQRQHEQAVIDLARRMEKHMGGPPKGVPKSAQQPAAAPRRDHYPTPGHGRDNGRGR